MSDKSATLLISAFLEASGVENSTAMAGALEQFLLAEGFQITPAPPPPEEWYLLNDDGRIADPDDSYPSVREAVDIYDSYSLFGISKIDSPPKWGFWFDIYSGDPQDPDYDGREINWYPTREEAERMLAEYLKPEPLS